jgi:hypothetical protein
MADLEKIKGLAEEILTHPTAQGHVIVQAQAIVDECAVVEAPPPSGGRPPIDTQPPPAIPGV